DQIGTFEGSGLVAMQGGAINMAMGGNVTTFSGLITGGGTLQVNNATGSLTLTNANTFSGGITSLANITGAGGIRLGHNRAAQNATLRLNNADTSKINISFATGIGTFVVGGLEGISKLLLQDTGGSAVTLQVGNNDGTNLYRGALSGSGGLTKIGTGTITLTGEFLTVTASTGGTLTTPGTTSHTYTGDTTILSGTHTNGGINSSNASTIKLDFNSQTTASVVNGVTYTATGTAATTNILSSASRLVLGGGRLWVAGNNAGGSASQTFNNTFLQTGRSYVTVTQGTTAAPTVVNLGNITRQRASILEFTLPVGTQDLTNGITTTTANGASGILGGWAIVGNEWAVKSTAGTDIGNVVAASAGVYTLYAGGNVVSAASSNLLVNDTSTTVSTATGVSDVNTLMIRNNAGDNATVNRILDIEAGETLRLGETGSIWNQGTGTLAIGTGANVGILTAGGADNTDGEIILHQTGGGEITLRSSIRDNGSGAVTFVRTGAGASVIISGTNTHTGGSVFTQGRTRVDSLGGLGSGRVTVTAGGQLWMNASGAYANAFSLAGTGYGEAGIPGALRLSGGQTLNGIITLTGDTRIGAVNASAVSTLAGKITGDFGLDLAGGASNANIIVLSNATNDFTGNLSLNTNLNGTAAFSNALVTVRLGASEVIPNGLGKGNVVLSGGTVAVTLDLNGFSETINSLISYGTHTNTFVTNNATGTTSTLTLGDNNTSTLIAANATYSTFFGGALQNGLGTLALTKVGEGTQTLTGANTYSGQTLISKGILQAGAVNTLSANSDFVLASDATVILALTNGIADFSQTIKSLAGAGMVNLGTIAAADTVATPGTRLTTGSTGDTTYSGQMAGAGGLVKQGTGRFTLTGANSYVGTTTVATGNLQVGQAGAGQSGTGQVTVNTGATLSGTGKVQGATTINGILSAGDNGGTGMGKLTFSDVTTGSLVLSGGATSADPRALFTLGGATGSEGNPTDGVQTSGLLIGNYGNHDHVEVQGSLTLTSGSVIKVVLADSYTPAWGDVFNLLDWATVNGSLVAGTFNVATDLDLQVSTTMTANGWYWETNQFLSDGIIYVVPEPGRAVLLLIALVGGLMRRRRGW
ncbi:MAG: beta strand repeat-containing protein, partial [Verrucomicrobium sp.]